MEAGQRKKIVLFGGTTEGRQLTAQLKDSHIPSVVCVATEYGKRVLGEALSYCDILVGRMDAEQMKSFLQKTDVRFVIDATHPYATEVTENISAACTQLGISVYRVVRESVPYLGQVVCVDTPEEAVRYLAEQDGVVLITTGSKELKFFRDFPEAQERLIARILPAEPSVRLAKECGFGMGQLICEAGPFSVEQNVEQLKRIDAKYLLTKDTGREGGFPEKLAAAEQMGVILVVIRRPTVEDGISVEDMKSILNRL